MACSKFRCPGWAMEPERARITIRHPFATFPRDVNCLGRSSSPFRDGAIRPHGPRSLRLRSRPFFGWATIRPGRGREYRDWRFASVETWFRGGISRQESGAAVNAAVWGVYDPAEVGCALPD